MQSQDNTRCKAQHDPPQVDHQELLHVGHMQPHNLLQRKPQNCPQDHIQILASQINIFLEYLKFSLSHHGHALHHHSCMHSPSYSPYFVQNFPHYQPPHYFP
jgi:hypothetical protein